MDTSETLSESLDGLTKKIDVNATFRKPRTVGTRTVIPVVEISYEFDLTQETRTTASCAENKGGVGAKAQPIAYIEIDEGEVRVKPIVDGQKIALAGILLAGWAAGWLGVVLKRVFRPVTES